MFGLRIALRTLATSTGRRAISKLQNFKSSKSVKMVTAVGFATGALVLASTAESSGSVDIVSVRKDIAAAIESDDKRRGDGTSIGI